MLDLDKAVHTLMKENPNYTTIEALCRGDLEDVIKSNPNVIRKGRWLYYNYNGKLIYIRILKFKEPTGHKTVHYSKVMNPKLVHYLTENMGDKQREAALYDVVWKTFDLKKID